MLHTKLLSHDFDVFGAFDYCHIMQINVKSGYLFENGCTTFNIDFAQHDGNGAQKNAFRFCDINFIYKTIRTEKIKPVTIKMEHTIAHSEKLWVS